MTLPTVVTTEISQKLRDKLEAQCGSSHDLCDFIAFILEAWTVRNDVSNFPYEYALGAPYKSEE